MADGTIKIDTKLDASGADRGIKDLQGKLQGAAKGMQGIGQNMSTYLTAPLAVAGTTALTVAADYSSAGVTIKNGLGVAGDEAERLTTVAQNIYTRGFGASMSDVTDAIVTVKQNMGDLVSDSELEKVSIDAMNLANVMGEDVGWTTRATSTIMKEFGSSSTEAMDLLAWGSQNGLNYSQELLDNVSEYGPLFANMGYSAEDYFAILYQGTEEGAYNLDYLNDVMKEFQIKLQDGSSAEAIGQLSDGTQDMFEKWKNGEATASQVMEAISGDLGKMDRETAEAIGPEIFGTKFEDLGLDAVLALGNVEGAIEGVDGSMANITENVEESFGTKLQSTLRTAGEALLPLGEILLDMANDWLPKVADVVQKLADWFNNLSPAVQKFIVIGGMIAAALGPAIMIIGGLISAVAAIAPVFMAVVGAIASPIGLIVAAIVAFVALVITNWDTIKSSTIEIWNGIVEFFKTAWDWIKDIFFVAWEMIKMNLQTAWEGIKLFFQTGFEAWKLIFTTGWEIIKTIFTTVWEAIKTFLVTAWEGIVTFFSTAFEVLNTIFTTSWEFIKNIFITAWDGIVLVLTTVWDWITNAVTTSFETWKMIFQTGWDFIKNIFSTVWDAIKSVLQTVWNWIKHAVKTNIDLWSNIFKSGWELIKNVTTTVWNAIKSFFQTVWNGIKSIFSTVTNWLKNTIKTVWDAIKSVTSTIWNAIKSLISTVWNGIKSGVSTAINAVKSVVEKVWNTIKSVTSTVWNAVKSGVTNAIESARDTVSKVVGKIKSTIEKIWNGIKSTTDDVWDGIVSAIKGAINGVIGAINGMIGALNNVKIKLPKVPDWVPGFGGKGGNTLGFNIPKIPSLDVGTNFVTRDGLAMIHEGEAIVPAEHAGPYKKPRDDDNDSSGKNVTINQEVVINSPEPLSPYQVKKKTLEASRQMANEWKGV